MIPAPSTFIVGKDNDEKFSQRMEGFDRIFATGAKTSALSTPSWRRSGDVHPYNAVWKDDGDFICEQTAVSAIGGDSNPLKDTCTCSCGKFHGMFDIFKMPSSGECEDTNKAELLND
ncbi:hypothetical protein BJ166DRAFT_598312 [Pestalotiopsis sp. NC0098]|nr:hypothetical protein BJ166DRAFT_598312 [Pestalotiopsis sp. NC0098]